MTPEQVKLQKKATALNAIRKIYNPKYKFPYNEWSDESGAEQRESQIRWIIYELEKDLQKLKHKVAQNK